MVSSGMIPAKYCKNKGCQIKHFLKSEPYTLQNLPDHPRPNKIKKNMSCSLPSAIILSPENTPTT